MIVNNRNIIIGLNLIYNLLMLFYELFPNYFALLLSIIFLLSNFYILNKKLDKIETLTCISIMMIPTSFISVIGTSFSSLPLSWFIVTVVAICILIIFKERKIDYSYLVFVCIFVIYGLYNINNSYNFYDAFKQFITIGFFYCSFFIASYLKNNKTTNLYRILFDIYILAVISFSLQIILQKAFIYNFDKIIGHYGKFGGGRVAYAALMGDYSFASLFIASGMLCLTLLYCEYDRINFLFLLTLKVLLANAIIITSARTGIFSYVVVMVCYFISNFKNFNRKYFESLLLDFGIWLFMYNGIKLIRGTQKLTDSSGRVEGYISSFQIIKDNFWFGCGFGIKNFVHQYNKVIPHNYFIQYLSQAGLIGISIITFPIFLFIRKVFNKCNKNIFLILLMIIGAMFIPDILNSRFLYAVILLTALFEYSKFDKEYNR